MFDHAPAFGDVPRWLTPEQAADLTGYSTKTIYRALTSGELATSKRRNRWRIRPPSLSEWIEDEPATEKPAAPSPARAIPSIRRKGSLGAILAAQEQEEAA